MSFGKNMYLDSIEIELKRRIDGLVSLDQSALAMWEKAVKGLTSNEARMLNYEAYCFAQSIEYLHDGLSSPIYFCHSLRVAGLSIYGDRGIQPETGVIAILHNIFEVSRLSANVVQDKFGGSVCDQLLSLKVDRDAQWDSEYKDFYYQTLNLGPRSAKIVKIFDKLDNLFLINRNPNRDIRILYMQEIERYIIPMAELEVPEAAVYIHSLLEFVRATELEG